MHQTVAAGERDAVGPLSVGLAGRTEFIVRERRARARAAVAFPQVDGRPRARLEGADVFHLLSGRVAAHVDHRLGVREPTERRPIPVDDEMADADATPSPQQERGREGWLDDAQHGARRVGREALRVYLLAIAGEDDRSVEIEHRARTQDSRARGTRERGVDRLLVARGKAPCAGDRGRHG